MKKIPIFLAALLLGVLLNVISPGKTRALQLTDGETTWYSVEELLEYNEIVEAEDTALCGNNADCYSNLYLSRVEAGRSKYLALDLLREGRFWLNTIDPAADHFEVIYFEEDEMLRRWGIVARHPLHHILLAWFTQPNTNIGNYTYYYPAAQQLADDMHLLYEDDAEQYGGRYPANQLFDLPIAMTNLEDNQLGRIYLAIFGDGTNSKGFLDYSSCYNDGYYQAGDACRLFISDDHQYAYFTNAKINASLTETEIITDNQPEPSGEPTIESPVEPADESPAEPIVIVPRTPNTGNLAGVCEKVIEFPWWLGTIILVGILTLLWLFWPKNRKKSQKNT